MLTCCGVGPSSSDFWIWLTVIWDIKQCAAAISGRCMGMLIQNQCSSPISFRILYALSFMHNYPASYSGTVNAMLRRYRYHRDKKEKLTEVSGKAAVDHGAKLSHEWMVDSQSRRLYIDVKNEKDVLDARAEMCWK